MVKSKTNDIYIGKKEESPFVKYQEPFFTEVAKLAYHKHETEIWQTISEDFKTGYISGCSDTLKTLYDWEELDMTSAETFELLKKINDKLDKLDENINNKLNKMNDKVSDIDGRLISLETENRLTWKSKQIWIPIMCSIIVAILGAIFEGKIHF